MPAPQVVTDDEILAAGRQLRNEGRPVTGWTLRAALGDRGKASRLLAVWDAAGDQEPEPEAPPAPPPLPAAIEERANALRERVGADLGAFASEIWTAAERLAAERTRAETARASERYGVLS